MMTFLPMLLFAAADPGVDLVEVGVAQNGRFRVCVRRRRVCVRRRRVRVRRCRKSLTRHVHVHGLCLG